MVWTYEQFSSAGVQHGLLQPEVIVCPYERINKKQCIFRVIPDNRVMNHDSVKNTLHIQRKAQQVRVQSSSKSKSKSKRNENFATECVVPVTSRWTFSTTLEIPFLMYLIKRVT